MSNENFYRRRDTTTVMRKVGEVRFIDSINNQGIIECVLLSSCRIKFAIPVSEFTRHYEKYLPKFNVGDKVIHRGKLCEVVKVYELDLETDVCYKYQLTNGYQYWDTQEPNIKKATKQIDKKLYRDFFHHIADINKESKHSCLENIITAMNAAWNVFNLDEDDSK